MIFEYDKGIISTQDELKISVGDLRDLIQTYAIKMPNQALDEYSVILDSILRKNGIPKGSITVDVA